MALAGPAPADRHDRCTAWSLASNICGRIVAPSGRFLIAPHGGGVDAGTTVPPALLATSQSCQCTATPFTMEIVDDLHFRLVDADGNYLSESADAKPGNAADPIDTTAPPGQDASDSYQFQFVATEQSRGHRKAPSTVQVYLYTLFGRRWRSTSPVREDAPTRATRANRASLMRQVPRLRLRS